MADEAVGGADVDSGSPASTLDIGWPRAGAIGLGVLVYFGVFTVWLPSKLIRLDAIASAPQWVQDVVVTGSWFAALVFGLVGLRRAQSRGLI